MTCQRLKLNGKHWIHNILNFPLCRASTYRFSKPVSCVCGWGFASISYARSGNDTRNREISNKWRKTQWTHGRTLFFALSLSHFIYMFTSNQQKKIHFLTAARAERAKEKQPSRMRAIKVHCIPLTKAHLLLLTLVVASVDMEPLDSSDDKFVKFSFSLLFLDF